MTDFMMSIDLCGKGRRDAFSLLAPIIRAESERSGATPCRGKSGTPGAIESASNYGAKVPMQVRFKTLPDPKNPDGLLVTFETVGSLVQYINPLTVTFKSKFDLDSAFMAAGIYQLSIDCTMPLR
jgi:hypothetical protein